jgi:hypothetical protein
MKINIVKNHLKGMRIAIKNATGGKYFRGKYFCLEDFVLKNGLQFNKIIAFPPDLKRGRVGSCHKNAYNIAQNNPNKYFYCEGYATSNNFAFLHSWVVNKELEVIDPTWKNGIDYYGIIFRFSYVADSMAKVGKFISIIDNWKDNYSLLKMSKKQLSQHTIQAKVAGMLTLAETDGSMSQEAI